MRSPIAWKGGALELIDQTRLPWEYKILKLRSCEEVAEAIEGLAVRGAPAIGVAAAYGVALGMQDVTAKDDLDRRFAEINETLKETRPTAVNLFRALERMKEIFAENRSSGLDKLKKALLAEAHRIREEDIEANKQIGGHGAELIKDDDTILTHCNAGALATAGYGTALGVIRAAWEAGKKIKVLATETRPLLQGARLTAWELKEEGIPFELICDSMAGYLMEKNRVDEVLVGADRITANGDTANKIGTYSLAVLAKYHGIPFYVAAPTSTIDPALENGTLVPIEQRSPHEVTQIQGVKVAPEGASARNVAFDVTPNALITAIITEKGVLKPPFSKAIADVLH